MRLPGFFAVGRRFQLREPAGYDDVPGFGHVLRVFEQDSFGSAIGNTVPLRIAGEIVGWGAGLRCRGAGGRLQRPVHL